MNSPRKSKFADNIRKSPVHREHVAGSVIILALNIFDAANFPRVMVTIVLSVLIAGREMLPVMFDELDRVTGELKPVEVEVED